MKHTLIKIIQDVASKTLEPTIKTLPGNRQNQILLSLQYRESAVRHEKLDFDQVGFNVYSLTNEDGILLYIFSVIGTGNKVCVDVGSGAITGSSVANLIINHGFKAILVDGNSRNIKTAWAGYSRLPETRLTPPKMLAAMVTVENINTLLADNGCVGEVDLFCLDIDGIDFWIWKALTIIQPRVVLVEYQDLLGPELSWTVPYKPDFSKDDYPVNREHNNYCGASLQAFVKLGRQKGYRLIGCNKGGWNAFFMKNGIGEALFPEEPAGNCFRFEWNRFGMEHRFPLVKNMEWQEI